MSLSALRDHTLLKVGTDSEAESRLPNCQTLTLWVKQRSAPRCTVRYTEVHARDVVFLDSRNGQRDTEVENAAGAQPSPDGQEEAIASPF